MSLLFNTIGRDCQELFSYFANEESLDALLLFCSNITVIIESIWEEPGFTDEALEPLLFATSIYNTVEKTFAKEIYEDTLIDYLAENDTTSISNIAVQATVGIPQEELLILNDLVAYATELILESSMMVTDRTLQKEINDALTLSTILQDHVTSAAQYRPDTTEYRNARNRDEEMRSAIEQQEKNPFGIPEPDRYHNAQAAGARYAG